MDVLDLFSGIGGFSLGLERAGMRTVAFCEIDPYCQAVLRKHWPDVPIHDDIRTLEPPSADVVCGGFPCQPFSTASAGKRKGQADDRYLWPEMLRVVRQVRPAWVVGENVAGIRELALEQVVSDLEGEGYEVATLDIPACAVGHDHRRSRYWFLGYANSDGQPERALNEEVAWLPGCGGDAGSMGKAYGLPTRMDRLRALGNSVVPQVVEVIGRAIMDTESSAKRAVMR